MNRDRIASTILATAAILLTAAAAAFASSSTYPRAPRAEDLPTCATPLRAVSTEATVDVPPPPRTAEVKRQPEAKAKRRVPAVKRSRPRRTRRGATSANSRSTRPKSKKVADHEQYREVIAPQIHESHDDDDGHDESPRGRRPSRPRSDGKHD